MRFQPAYKGNKERRQSINRNARQDKEVEETKGKQLLQRNFESNKEKARKKPYNYNNLHRAKCNTNSVTTTCDERQLFRIASKWLLGFSEKTGRRGKKNLIRYLMPTMTYLN